MSGVPFRPGEDVLVRHGAGYWAGTVTHAAPGYVTVAYPRAAYPRDYRPAMELIDLSRHAVARADSARADSAATLTTDLTDTDTE
jgi:hypothetical protein